MACKKDVRKRVILEEEEEETMEEMGRSENMEDIESPATRSRLQMMFPKEDDDSGDDVEKALSWGQVPIKKWFLIRSQRWIQTENFGRRMLAILQDEAGQLYEVWVPRKMSEQINLKISRKTAKEELFVKTLELRSAGDGCHSYYDYRLQTRSSSELPEDGDNTDR